MLMKAWGSGVGGGRRESAVEDPKGKERETVDKLTIGAESREQERRGGRRGREGGVDGA